MDRFKRRVFHLFESELPTVELLMKAVEEQFPGIPEKEALRLFYDKHWPRIIQKAHEDTARAYASNPELAAEMDSVIMDQCASPVLDFED